MKQDIGVYTCHCGTNIAATVDCNGLAQFSSTLPGVKVARDYRYLCSDPGQDLIKKDIRELSIDRVVVAACSPRMHEMTFRNAISSEGLNPYCLNIANIREQCSWVHKDRREATEKAKQLLRAAVARVLRQEGLTPRKVEIKPSVLVVGAGIAGIQAALTIANEGTVVEVAIPVIFFGLIAWIVYSTGLDPWNKIKDVFLVWFLVHGILSGIGVAIARGHPLSILTAFVAAPFTSLEPFFAPGWFAGLVEAKLRKPLIKDFQELSKIESIRGFLKNKVIRLLMVVALGNLGSIIGTIIALPWILNLGLG